MKIIALEEHVVTPGVLEAWAQVPTAKEDGVDPGSALPAAPAAPMLIALSRPRRS